MWSIIGAIAQTCRLPVTTAVTCPTVRIHPAIVAQAAATSNVLLDGRFALGVGTGEALNEHVTTSRWPNIDVRLDMLEEAVAIIRQLWSRDYVTHHGRHYSVENARIYTRTQQPPPVYVSGLGPKAADLAGRIGDGYITTQPDPEMLRRFRASGGDGKPAQAGYKVCWSGEEKVAVATAHRLWSTSGLPGELAQVLPSPRHFEQASALVTEQMTRDAIACGPDIDQHVRAFQPFADAGFDEVYIAQIGGAEAETSSQLFFEAYADKVLPRLRSTAAGE